MSKSHKNPSKPYPAGIVGKAYIQLIQEITQLAKHNTNVLFSGETGCGKEVFAKHYMNLCAAQKGERRTQLCTALSGENLYSMMFGHKKGAYTGAEDNRNGLVKTCKNGIVFLDELGDASEDFQVSLLRVIEGNSYTPLGSDKEEKVENVLFIAATSRPEKVRDEIKFRFKEVYIPPLQKSDIPDITTHFLQEIKKSKNIYPTKAILDTLMKRNYPGNVRELKQGCDDLFIEKGDRILSKRPPELPTYINLDYKRFVRERKIWKQHLQHLVDKYDLNIEYEYMLQFDEVHQYLTTKGKRIAKAKYMNRGKAFIKDKPDEEKFLSAFLPLQWNVEKFLDLIIWLENGDEKKSSELNLTLPDLEKTLADLKKNDGWLPWLLDRLDEEFNPTDTPTSPFLPMPDMTFLLDLPIKEATKEFNKILIEYNLEKYSYNKNETAEALGISIVTLNRKIK